MTARQFIFFFFLFAFTTTFAQRSFELSSPGKSLLVSVELKDTLSYELISRDGNVLSTGQLALLLPGGSSPGIRPVYSRKETKSIQEIIVNPVPYKRRSIPNEYNELSIYFKDNYAVQFRAYEDGFAYRFVVDRKDSLVITHEVCNFRFPGNQVAYFPKVQQRENADIFHTSFEEPYTIAPLNSLSKGVLGFAPVLLQGERVKLLITESDLHEYPGMFLSATGSSALQGAFAGYPEKEEIRGDEFKQKVVTARRNYIAKTSGTRTFPWRVVGIARADRDLLQNDMVYKLASPDAGNTDWSWIKPGISTEEWIIGSNIYGVPFQAGINTATYKYYIDFASRFGMQYVMLDAGWSDVDDLFKVKPAIDLQELADYARSKNIGLILWTLSLTLERQLDEALAMFKKYGVKAIMTDFMDRDDQVMINFYEKVAKASAEHQIMVMFHGAFKNTGLERRYPHLITREGVLGSEYNIWSDKANPDHDVLIPFIRMFTGPMDYEPGFYTNANQRTFRALPDMVMSMGTRVHQLAMFVVYESPLQMFSGNPSDAYQEIEFTTYLASIPTVWHDLEVLEAKLGEYLVVARRKDNDWYIGALTDWTPREFKVNLSFLGEGKYRAFICQDGPNASKHAADYQMGYRLVDRTDTLTINMAPGGGYVVKLIKLFDARP